MDNQDVAQALVRLAKTIVAGCEKLPEGGMRENCEKKKEEGKKNKEDKKAVLAGQLVKLARELTGQSRVASDDIRGVKKEVDMMISSRPLYVVVKVVSIDGDPRGFRITGSILAVGNWLKETKVLSWELEGFTTDRNEARKRGDEV